MTMATIKELIQQYESDPALQKELEDILADNKVTISEFISFAKKHDVDVSVEDLPKYMEDAKKLGFIL